MFPPCFSAFSTLFSRLFYFSWPGNPVWPREQIYPSKGLWARDLGRALTSLCVGPGHWRTAAGVLELLPNLLWCFSLVKIEIFTAQNYVEF